MVKKQTKIEEGKAASSHKSSEQRGGAQGAERRNAKERRKGERREASAPVAVERRQIERALEETGGQIAKAAELLDVSRTTLWEKMTRLRCSVSPARQRRHRFPW